MAKTDGIGETVATGRLLLPAGSFLLVLGMALTIVGIPVPPLFRPGTWLILIALLAVAAGAAARVPAASVDGA